MSRLALSLALVLLVAACDEGGVVGVDPASGRTVEVGSAADLPLGFRAVCDPGACGPVPDGAGASCGAGRYDGASCLATDVAGTSCVWMNVPCADTTGAAFGDAGSGPSSSDGGLSSADAGLPPAADGGLPSADGGSDGGTSPPDGSAWLDACGGGTCAGPAPEAPTCFDGAQALVVCGPTSSGGCGWLFRCGAP
ncbi:MAG: hypothetical protein U0230_20930 [Polyangiales bacterium]